METITPPQINLLHVLYRNLKIDSKGLLSDFTGGRTDCTAGLTKEEAGRLISALKNEEPTQKERRIIFSLAYQAGIISGVTPKKIKENVLKLDAFIKKSGTVKKSLKAMTIEELNLTIAQMKVIVVKNAVAADHKHAKAVTDNLLNELNITVSNK